MKPLFLILFSLFFVSACSTSNLQLLTDAQSEFYDGNYGRSDELFEEFNRRNTDPTRTSITAEAAGLVAGPAVNDYKPYMMDYLFVSYYQLWDALLSGRNDDARVIINQSYERQQKMSIAYRTLISKRTDDNTDLKTDTSMWAAYDDIMNPALTYMAGLYFLNIGEHENARQYLTRAGGMMPNNEYIRADLNNKNPKNMAWLFIETGVAPRLQERRLDIPWPVGGHMQVISVATTEPVVSNTQSPIPNTRLLADTNAMFMTEYNEYQINDALRAAAKAATNIALQSTAQNQFGGLGGLAGAIYSIATTRADTRSWTALPQRIYLLRAAKDKSGLIKLRSGVNIECEYDGNHIIFVRGTDIKKIKIK